MALPDQIVGGWKAAARAKDCRSRLGLAAIALLYLLLSLWYSQAAPVLEIGDEVWHYQVIDHVAAGRGLPILADAPGLGVGHQEAGQPPLYYLWSALTIRAVDPDP